jgi:hypothetical protein
MVQEHPVHRFPGPGGNGFDVFLQRGAAGILPPAQPGKRPEGYGVFQMKGQFFAGQFPVLFQNGATQHLLGRHAAAAGIRALVVHQVLKNQLQDPRILVQDLGNGLQFPGYFIPRRKMQKISLLVPFLAHTPTSESYLFKSNQPVITIKITLSELNRDKEITLYYIISTRYRFWMRTSYQMRLEV